MLRNNEAMESASCEIPGTSDRRFNAAILFAMAATFLGVVSCLNSATHDMLHGMALFREALALGYLPRDDVFAYTPTVSPTVHHEWGMGGILYLASVASGLGAAGIMLVKYLLTATVVAGCYLCARWRGTSLPVFAVLAGVVVPFGWVGFGTVRAQLFTMAFLVCTLGLFELDRRGRRWWIAVWLPMNVIWLNVHGGFVAGVGLFALYTIERFVREWTASKSIVRAGREVGHLLFAGIALIPLLAVNPYGWEYIEYLWHALRMDRSLIREWAPLWQTYQPMVTMEFYVVSVALVIYAAVTRGVRNLPQLVLVAVAAWLALWHIRHGAIYAVVWLCYVPAFIEETPLGCRIRSFWHRRTTLVRRATVVCGVLGLIVAVHNRFWELQVPTTDVSLKLVYPGGACDYLAEHHFEGNVMVPFSAGSFVSWKLYPAVKVSLDGRYEAAYPPGALNENIDFYAARPGWKATLTRYDTDAVLVRRGSPLETELQAMTADEKGPSAPWRQIYSDDGFSLYLKSSIAERFPTVDRTGTALTAQIP